MRPATEAGSVLDALGAELIGVISPVSICMLLVVLLISTTASTSSGAGAAAVTSATTAATLVYSESPSDSTSRKLAGALLNAAAFVVIIAVVTFALVLLYYYRCTGFLRGYTRFSAFLVLATMGGPILVDVLRRLAVPLDAPSAALILLDLSAVGALVVFSPAAPVVLRQAYLVAIAAIVAAWFARLPEWTTWALLIALALYDLAAVLCPHGPLRILVNLASSRDDDDLPALIYEARPAAPSVSHAVAAVTASSPAVVELQPIGDAGPPRSSDPHQTVVEVVNLNAESVPLMRNQPSSSSGSGRLVGGQCADVPPPPPRTEEANREGGGDRNHAPVLEADSDDDDMLISMRGIRLGLGDFVFYSVLVGRAAMYDLMTVYACYLAIISGLACTLILLSVFRHALPALPISIALGTCFYFLTRLLMEPFVVGASMQLVMF